MSWQATTFALRVADLKDAAVPGKRSGGGTGIRKLVLMGFADHAHDDGTRSFPYISTVAGYADIDDRTVTRHVTWLVEHGFMREGDQRHVFFLDVRHRPIVYDLALSNEQAALWARERAAAAPGSRDAWARHGADGGRAAAHNALNVQVGRGDNESPLDPDAKAQVGRGDNESPLDCFAVTPGSGLEQPSRGDSRITQNHPSQKQTPPLPPTRLRRRRRGGMTTTTRSGPDPCGAARSSPPRPSTTS